MSQIQYVIDDKNIVTGVIVPIDLWRKIQIQNKKVQMRKRKREKMREGEERNYFRGMDNF